MQRFPSPYAFRERRETHVLSEFLSGAVNTTVNVLEAPLPFTGVNVAYGLGALAVIGGGIFLFRKAYEKVLG